MKKIQKIGFLFVLMLTCLVLVSCNTVKASDLIGVLMIEQEEGYVAEDFFVIGELKSGDETYPVTWTTDNDCLTVSSEKNAAGYYTVVVSRPEDEMQQVTLTATLTVAKGNTATKSYVFKVYPIDVYDLLDNFKFEYSGTKVEMGTSMELPTTTTFDGKSATITWACDSNLVTINEAGNKATLGTVVKDTKVTLSATLTYKGESTTIKYEVTIAPYATNFELLKEWYENTGVSQKLSGYIVDIAANYDEQYGNVSLYIINDDFTGGYYLYRVKTDADNGAKIKVGAHVTATNTVNTNYSGLMETSAGGNLVVDEDIAPINVSEKIYAIDNDLLANAPTLYYRLSTQVSLSNWKVKSVSETIDDGESSAVTIMTVEKDGLEIKLRYSNYLACTPMPNRNKGVKTENYLAIEAKLATIAVGDYVNLSGILSYYNSDSVQYDQESYQILVQNADSIVKIDNGSDETNTVGKKVGEAITSFEGFLAAYVVDTTIELPATLGDATVTWAFHNPYHTGAELVDGNLVITPAGYSIVSLDATFTIGDYSTKVYYSFVVEKLSDEQIADRTLGEVTVEDVYAPGDIQLPTTHDIYEGVVISYELKDTYVSATLEGNVLTINNKTLEENETITLIVTVTKGDEVKSGEVTFTVHKLEVVSGADFLAAKEKDVPSLLHGYITAVASTSGTGSFVFTDLNGTSIFCYTKINVTLGSEVKLLAVYAVNNDHPQLGNPEVIEVISNDNNVAEKSGEVVNVTAESIKENVTTKTRPELVSIYSGKYLEIVGYVVANGSNFGIAPTAESPYVVNIYANSGLKNEIAAYVGQQVKLYGFSRGASAGETGNITLQAQAVVEIPLTDPQEIANYEANAVSFESTYKAGEVELPVAKKFDNVELSYVVKSGSEFASIVDGKLVLVADGSENKEVVITVTATLEGQTASRDITIIVLADIEYVASLVTSPVADTEYYLAIEQGNLKKTIYFNGKMSGYYGATTEIIADALKVTLVTVEGGYNIKFTIGDATKYINAVVSGDHKNFTLDNTASTVWVWNPQHNTFTTTLGSATVYTGTYGTYNTFSISTIDKIGTSFPAHLYEMKAISKDEKRANDNAAYIEGLFDDVKVAEAKDVVVTLPHAGTLTVTPATGSKTLVWDAANNKLTITPLEEELTETVTFVVTVGKYTRTVEVEISTKLYVAQTGTPVNEALALTFTAAANKASADTYMKNNFPAWTITGKLGQTYGGYLGFGRSGDGTSAITSGEFTATSDFQLKAVIKGNGSSGVMTSTLTFNLLDDEGNVIATGYADGVSAIKPVDAKDTTYTISFTYVEGKTFADAKNLKISFKKATGNIGLKSLAVA